MKLYDLPDESLRCLSMQPSSIKGLCAGLRVTAASLAGMDWKTWLLHASAAWSEAHIEENATLMAQELLHAFRQLGGPEPAALTAHRWRYADTEPALSKLFAWDASACSFPTSSWASSRLN